MSADLSLVLGAKGNMQRLQDLYSNIRYTDRPVQEAIDPEAYVVPPGDVTADYEGKKYPSSRDLYPEIDEFATYPADRYFSKEIMDLEWDRMWAKTWLIAGRCEDIPNVGDWFRFDIGKESFIIVRSDKDSIRAFYNVCKHRGNRIVTDDFGSGAKSFTCIVHSWRWNIKGQNVRVTDKSTFKPEAICGDMDLGEVHVHTWGGFVFINMAADPVPFETYYEELLPVLASYRLEELFVVKDVTLEVPGNWKMLLEPFLEAYHAHATHPQIMPFVEDYYCQTDFYPNGHNRQMFPSMIASIRWPHRQKITELLSQFASEAGLDPALFEEDALEVRRAIQQVKRRSDNPFGMDYTGFTDNQLTDDWNPGLFPNCTLNMHPEGVLFMRFRPHATDPEKSYYDVMVLSRKLAEGVSLPAYMGVGPEVDISGNTRPERIYSTLQDTQLGEVLDQDIFNIANMQNGIHSRGLTNVVRFSQQESRIQQHHAELERYLTGKK